MSELKVEFEQYKGKEFVSLKQGERPEDGNYHVRWPLVATSGKTRLEALGRLREWSHYVVDMIIGDAIGVETGKKPPYIKQPF